MKKLLLLLLSCISLWGNAQIEYAFPSSVFVIEKTKNKVWAQKLDSGMVFHFEVSTADIGKFKAGMNIGIQINNKKAFLPGNERVNVSAIEVEYDKAREFGMHYAYLILKSKALVKPGEYGKFEEMNTLVRSNSAVVKACCENGSGNGVIFNLRSTMTETDIERKVFVFNKWVFVDKRGLPFPSLLIFPVSGTWTDTSRNSDTAAIVKAGFDQGSNIKMRPPTRETDKWTITPDEKMKGVLGGLNIDFPEDVVRNILIYQQEDNKFLTSVSRNAKSFPFAPGQYRFVLSSVPVENVPIQKGHETKLKFGFLNLVSEGNWHLYNEPKDTAYTSGNKPGKLALPPGNYQLKLGGQFYAVIIKDGETVEY